MAAAPCPELVLAQANVTVSVLFPLRLETCYVRAPLLTAADTWNYTQLQLEVRQNFAFQVPSIHDGRVLCLPAHNVCTSQHAALNENWHLCQCVSIKSDISSAVQH
jgi:hypothetical protein